MSAGAAPAGLGHRRRQLGEVESAQLDRQVLVVVAAAGVVEVNVRHPVAVLAEKVGLGGSAQPGDERVASVETHRRVRGRRQRREAGDVDEITLRFSAQAVRSRFRPHSSSRRTES